MHRKLSNPSTIHKPMGYSHVAEISGGRIVFIAGQVALDTDGSLVGKSDYALQVRQAFSNLGAALSAAGATFRDLIKVTYYCADIVDPAIQLDVLKAVRDGLFDGETPPISTFVVVRRLARQEWLIEIEGVAALPV
jgi:enamine deaminase RidA (YjgF/YER057c/UK114 family)